MPAPVGRCSSFNALDVAGTHAKPRNALFLTCLNDPKFYEFIRNVRRVLERAGFEHTARVALNMQACNTLLLNRPERLVIEGDLSEFDARNFKGIDLVAGGVPCPSLSKAGKKLGGSDERDMSPPAICFVNEIRFRAVLIENCRGILDVILENRSGAALEYA